MRRPCGECHIQTGETCDICGVREPDGLQSTQAMRDRIRELARPAQCDYDRAVICVLNDLEAKLQ